VVVAVVVAAVVTVVVAEYLKQMLRHCRRGFKLLKLNWLKSRMSKSFTV
jgi:hypothetical protein